MHKDIGIQTPRFWWQDVSSHMNGLTGSKGVHGSNLVAHVAALLVPRPSNRRWTFLRAEQFQENLHRRTETSGAATSAPPRWIHPFSVNHDGGPRPLSVMYDDIASRASARQG
jgi:hypothetical protein